MAKVCAVKKMAKDFAVKKMWKVFVVERMAKDFAVERMWKLFVAAKMGNMFAVERMAMVFVVMKMGKIFVGKKMEKSFAFAFQLAGVVRGAQQIPRQNQRTPECFAHLPQHLVQIRCGRCGTQH
jgi:hypothetical protein